MANITDTFNGTFTNNTSNENRDFGFSLTAAQFLNDSTDTPDPTNNPAQISGNTANLNSDEGFVLSITGSGVSGIRVLSNTLTDNNSGNRDFLATYSGTGALTMTLDGNTTNPTGTLLTDFITPTTILGDPSLTLNYDIQNTSTGIFTLNLGTNTGNVGHSEETSPTVVPFTP